MRWILVFIFLYVIPLMVLFKNYKKFSRACIYACTYVVLATTIVISNMYISGIKQLEKNNSMVMNYKEIYTSKLDVDNVEQDLSKIKQYKSDIVDIENIALNPIKECGVYSEDIKTYITDKEKMKKDIDKAKYMSERVIELYDDMEVPQLSKKEYTKTLKECTRYMKESYELKYKAIDQIDKLIKNDNIDDVSNIKKYIKQSDEKINKYQKQISELETKIKDK